MTALIIYGGIIVVSFIVAGLAGLLCPRLTPALLLAVLWLPVLWLLLGGKWDIFLFVCTLFSALPGIAACLFGRYLAGRGRT